MAGIPAFRGVPHPSEYGEVREFMRERVGEFIQGKAWVHIVDPMTVVTTTNITAGTMVVDATPIWSGWARIQPVRNTVGVWRATNPTETRVVQFWLEDFPDDQAVDLRSGLRIVVNAEESADLNDPWLAQYQFVIDGGINSSQAWQRTVDTRVDLEGRPNYDMSLWPRSSGVC